MVTGAFNYNNIGCVLSMLRTDPHKQSIYSYLSGNYDNELYVLTCNSLFIIESMSTFFLN